MTDHVNGGPPVDPVSAMKAQLVIAMRDLERRFPSAKVCLLLFAEGAAETKPPYAVPFNYATTGSPADTKNVLLAAVEALGESK